MMHLGAMTLHSPLPADQPASAHLPPMVGQESSPACKELHRDPPNHVT